MDIVKSGESKEDNSFQNEIKLKKFSSTIFGINRNGVDMRCPFIPPTIMQKIIEGPALALDKQQPRVETFEQPKPCNSNCPLFMMEKNPLGDTYHVRLGCGSSLVEHKVTEIIPFIDKPSKK